MPFVVYFFAMKLVWLETTYSLLLSHKTGQPSFEFSATEPLCWERCNLPRQRRTRHSHHDLDGKWYHLLLPFGREKHSHSLWSNLRSHNARPLLYVGQRSERITLELVMRVCHKSAIQLAFLFSDAFEIVSLVSDKNKPFVNLTNLISPVIDECVRFEFQLNSLPISIHLLLSETLGPANWWASCWLVCCRVPCSWAWNVVEVAGIDSRHLEVHQSSGRGARQGTKTCRDLSAIGF